MTNKLFITIGILFLVHFPASKAQAINVVTTIKPIHSLVASVMENVSVPFLIIKTNASPHSYSLKPSDARALEDADIIFWLGEGMENFLTRPLNTLGSRAKSIQLLKVPGIQKLHYREWHGHESSPTKVEEEADHNHSHNHNDYDPHIWLDPDNARQMLKAIVKELTRADPDNAPTYQRNAQQTAQRITQLTEDIHQRLKQVRQQPYIVYHDAYQYFEQRFMLKPVAVVSLNPEIPASAKRIRHLQQSINRLEIRCIFSEPQFNPRTLKVLQEIPHLRKLNTRSNRLRHPSRTDTLRTALDEIYSGTYRLLNRLTIISVMEETNVRCASAVFASHCKKSVSRLTDCTELL